MFLPRDSWFKPNKTEITKSSITEIHILKEYQKTGNELDSWDASNEKNLSLIVYCIESRLIITKSKTENRFVCHSDSSGMFADFSNLKHIYGLDLLNTDQVQCFGDMFLNCYFLDEVDLTNFNMNNLNLNWQDRFIFDESNSYIKTIPSKIEPYIAIPKIGGMSYLTRNLLSAQPGTFTTSWKIDISIPAGLYWIKGEMTNTKGNNEGLIQFEYVNGKYDWMGTSQQFERTIDLWEDIKAITFFSNTGGYNSGDNTANGVKSTWTNVIMSKENIPYEPYGQIYDNKTDKIESEGINFFDVTKVQTERNNAEKVINNNDGSLTIITSSSSSGGKAGGKNRLKDYAPNLQIGQIYYLSAKTTGTHKYMYFDKAALTWTFGESHVVTKEVYNSTVFFYASGQNTEGVVSDIMLCEDQLRGTKYIPYSKKNYNIPMEVQNLSDYGVGLNLIYYNYINTEDYTYHHMVKKIKIDETNILVDASSSTFIYISLQEDSQYALSQNEYLTNMFSTNLENGYFTNFEPENYSNFLITERGMQLLGVSNATELIKKSKEQELYIVYVLSKPEIIKISSILSLPLLLFKVESQGRIIATNKNNYPIPWTAIYQKEVNNNV